MENIKALRKNKPHFGRKIYAFKNFDFGLIKWFSFDNLLIFPSKSSVIKKNVALHV